VPDNNVTVILDELKKRLVKTLRPPLIEIDKGMICRVRRSGDPSVELRITLLRRSPENVQHGNPDQRD
jgi:hypothetical protein